MSPSALITRLWAAAISRLYVSEADRERGDVPGWVMVTVMSAALVVAILTVARSQLTSVFQSAITSTTGR